MSKNGKIDAMPTVSNTIAIVERKNKIWHEFFSYEENYENKRLLEKIKREMEYRIKLSTSNYLCGFFSYRINCCLDCKANFRFCWA